jgi:L-2-hydroxycarboxylate dehydrogenase (NAD+)
MTTTIRLRADALRAFTSELFQRLGLPADDAAIASDVLVRADLRGVETHGIRNLQKNYVDHFRAGRANPRPQIRVLAESPCTALVDGDGGLGLVVGVRAMDLCIEKAKAAGVGIVVVRRSRHFGMAGYYSERCLEHGLIGVAMSDNGDACVVPTYGRQPMLNTNPLSVAAPAGEEPDFLLDMATSVVPGNRLARARERGQKIPLGWGCDQEGTPCDDPQAVLKARWLLPLGSTPELSSHKGYGLGVVVDILTGVLGGGLYGNLVDRAPADEPWLDRGSAAHFFLALRVDLFRPLSDFQSTMDDMLRSLKSSERASGYDRIYVHGEKEYEALQERSQHGIPYERQVIDGLNALAAEFGVDPIRVPAVFDGESEPLEWKPARAG